MGNESRKIRTKRDHHLFSYLSPRSLVNNEAKLDRFINLLNISYNILNSNTGNTNLDRLTAALFRLSSSQGYFAALNYLFTVSNVLQSYGGIISGIALKDSKKKHKEDSISAMEVSDRLQSSVDELNDRLSSTSEVILKLFYCTHITAGSKNKPRGKFKIQQYCSKQLDQLENEISNLK